MPKPNNRGPRLEEEDDDDLILDAEQLSPRIPEGVYDACVIRIHRPVMKFDKRRLVLVWRLLSPGDAFDVRLTSHCALPPPGRRLGSGMKVASWMRQIADKAGGSAQRMPIKVFKEFWFRVQVRTVTTDSGRKAKKRTDHYSCVDDIVEVAGKLAELSPYK